MNHIYMRFPGGRTKALTFSYDDGVRQDERFVALLNGAGMKATFNLNSGCYRESRSDPEKNKRLTEEEATAVYGGNGHEVAVHARTHPFLEELPIAVATGEILSDRLALEAQFGKIVRGMAYPYGTYNEPVVQMLKACGIAYARTCKSTGKFDLPENWLLWHPTCHHTSPDLMGLAKSFVEKPATQKARLFYLWGHTYEFDDNRNWDVIEAFVSYTSGRESEIWYATNLEIYEYVENYRRLVWSADGSLVFNPTAQELWFRSGPETTSVKPGQTLSLKKE